MTLSFPLLFSFMTDMGYISSVDNLMLYLWKIIPFIKAQILSRFPWQRSIILSNVSVAAFMSWVLAAVITTDNGMPFLSVNTCLLVPSLALSVVGLGRPVLSPLKVPL